VYSPEILASLLTDLPYGIQTEGGRERGREKRLRTD